MNAMFYLLEFLQQVAQWLLAIFDLYELVLGFF